MQISENESKSGQTQQQNQTNNNRQQGNNQCVDYNCKKRISHEL